MFAAIGTRLAASVLMQSPVGGFIRGARSLAKRVPWPVWVALALAIAVFVGVKIHTHKVEAFGERQFISGYAKGHADALADVEKANHAVETKGREMAQDVRSKNDAKTVVIERVAHDVFVRGPGRAACAPVAPAAADGSTGAGQGDAAVSGVSAGAGQPLVGVPLDAAVGFAKQNDKALADNASWWTWYDRYSAIIADYQRQIAALQAKAKK